MYMFTYMNIGCLSVKCGLHRKIRLHTCLQDFGSGVQYVGLWGCGWDRLELDSNVVWWF